MNQDRYFSSRKSVRKFSGREVPEALIDHIIEGAMKAPTTGNMQLYSVVVSRDPEMRARLAPAHFSQPAATGAPVLLTICADFHRFSRWCGICGADAGFDNFLSYTSAFADAMIFAQQIVTIAELEGLGTCYLGTVTYNASMIADILELPDLTVPVACLAIGWPDGEGEPTERLPLEAVRHNEVYRRDSDSRIMDLFKAKDEYPANARYVEENGKENLAQVFAEVRYPRAMNEEFSVGFMDYLRASGFLKES